METIKYKVIGVILNKVNFSFLFCGLIFFIFQSDNAAAQDQYSISDQWASFQNSDPGKYCFFSPRENSNKKKRHAGYIFVTISGDSISIKHEGVVIEGGNNWFYSDTYTGTMEGNRIFAIKSGDSQSTEFIIKNKSLINKHWMLKKNVSYTMEICDD